MERERFKRRRTFEKIPYFVKGSASDGLGGEGGAQSAKTHQPRGVNRNSPFLEICWTLPVMAIRRPGGVAVACGGSLGIAVGDGGVGGTPCLGLGIPGALLLLPLLLLLLLLRLFVGSLGSAGIAVVRKSCT